MGTPKLASQPAEVALPYLMEEYGGLLYRLGLKICGNPEDAEELVQETFLLAFRKWDQFRGEAKPTTWLYTIAARVCQRRKRLRAGEPQRVETLTELEDGTLPDIPDSAEGPLDAQLRREARETVERALASLPHTFRMPLVLKDIAELPVAEVAQILGLKPATVKTRVHRARLRLQKALAEQMPTRDFASDPEARVCLDFLHAKQEALDRGVPFGVPPEHLCEKCQGVFSALDLAGDACRQLSRDDLPPRLREALLEEFANT